MHSDLLILRAAVCRHYRLKPAEVDALPGVDVFELFGAIPRQASPAGKLPADEVDIEAAWRAAWEGIPE